MTCDCDCHAHGNIGFGGPDTHCWSCAPKVEAAKRTSDYIKQLEAVARASMDMLHWFRHFSDLTPDKMGRTQVDKKWALEKALQDAGFRT